MFFCIRVTQGIVSALIQIKRVHTHQKKKKKKSYEMLKHDNAATPWTKNEFDRTYSSPLQMLSNNGVI